MNKVTLEHTAAFTTYGGAGSAIVLWGLQLSEWGVIVSAFVAVLGFVVHCYYAHRRDRRAQEQHKATLERIRNADAAPYSHASSGDGQRD